MALENNWDSQVLPTLPVRKNASVRKKLWNYLKTVCLILFRQVNFLDYYKR